MSDTGGSEKNERWFVLEKEKEGSLKFVLRAIGEVDSESIETVLQRCKIFDVFTHNESFDCCVILIEYIQVKRENNSGHDAREYEWIHEIRIVAELPSGIKVILEPGCQLRRNHEEAERKLKEQTLIRENIEGKRIYVKKIEEEIRWLEDQEKKLGV